MSTKLPRFRFDAIAGYSRQNGKMSPTRNTVNEVLDRAFVDGEAEVVLRSLEDADEFSEALLARVESLTGSDDAIVLWGKDELPERYLLRVAWVETRAKMLSLPRAT